MLIKTDDNPTGLGWLSIDQRASGIPTSANGLPLFEADTYTCTHCNRVVVLNPKRERSRYKCRGCNHLICDPCAAERAAGKPCITMQQMIDEYMDRVAQVERQDAGEETKLILPPYLNGG